MKISQVSSGSILVKGVLIGALIGLLIGGGIVYSIFPRVITKHQNIVTESTIVDTVFVEKQKLIYKTRKEEKHVLQVDTIGYQSDSLLNDSLHIVDSSIHITDAVDTGELKMEQDSLEFVEDTLIPTKQVIVSSDGSKIRVSKNELVYAAYIQPSGNPSDFYCNTDTELDSLLVGNYTPKPTDMGIHVEFWSSPLHATGYQLSKNKLLLYGFYEYKNVKLKYLQSGKLQLTYFENDYELSCGGEFVPLVIKKR